MSTAAAAQRGPMSSSVKAAEMLDQYDNSHPEASGSSASRKRNLSCASCAAIFSSGFLVLLNFVFFILGVIVLALGAWAQSQKVGGGSVPAGLIFCGVMVSFCSLIGIWGAKRRSRFLLLVYVGLFSLVVLIEFILAIVVLANRDSIPGWVTDTWNDASNTTKRYFQDLYGCCGLSDEFPIPPDGSCPDDKNGNPVTDKCLPKMERDAQKSASAAGGVALVFALVEVVGIVLAQLLRNSQQAAQFEDDTPAPTSSGASRRIR